MDIGGDIIIKQTKNNGKGVFAGRNFSKGEDIFQFIGSLIHGNENIAPDSYLDNHCVQISKDYYIGPTGGPGDFINHSCKPNGGFQIKNKGAIIIAIRDIKMGEEITFDYSTSMAEDRYEIDCNCGSENCRKRIRDFKYLTKDIQNRYIKLDAVPKFIIDSIK